MTTIQITNSELFTFQRCLRLWFLRYYLGYTPASEEVTGSRILGTRIHTALEGFYGYGLDPLTVLHVLYRIALEASPDYESDLIKERDLASAMIEGYIEWLAETGTDAGLSVVAVERELVVPMPGMSNVQLRAKLDQVVLDEATGLLAFLDHKTAASFERHEILMLSPQFRFYSLIQKIASGDRPGSPRVLGGYVNTLRRVKRTDKSKPPYYQRDPFRYTEPMIDATYRKVSGLAGRIIQLREALDWIYTEGEGDLWALNRFQQLQLPPTPIETDCSWRCPFTELCPMMDEETDWAGSLVRSGQYRQENPYAHYENDPLAQVRHMLAAG